MLTTLTSFSHWGKCRNLQNVPWVLGDLSVGHVMCANQINDIKLKMMKDYFIPCSNDWYKYVTLQEICMENY